MSKLADSVENTVAAEKQARLLVEGTVDRQASAEMFIEYTAAATASLKALADAAGQRTMTDDISQEDQRDLSIVAKNPGLLFDVARASTQPDIREEMSKPHMAEMMKIMVASPEVLKIAEEAHDAGLTEVASEASIRDQLSPETLENLDRIVQEGAGKPSSHEMSPRERGQLMSRATKAGFEAIRDEPNVNDETTEKLQTVLSTPLVGPVARFAMSAMAPSKGSGMAKKIETARRDLKAELRGL